MKRYIQARTGKYYQGYVVQEYVPGYGWADVCTYDDTSAESLKDANAAKKDYIDNGYSARVITRKFENKDYKEPDHGITLDDVLNYVQNDCPYPVKELNTTGSCNYMIGNWGHCCQVFSYKDNTAGVYNCQTRRTKTVYTIDELIKAVDKIVKG